RVGLRNWIERQLAPAGIPDEAVRAQLEALPSLTMTIPDLLREYPRESPAAVAERARRAGAAAGAGQAARPGTPGGPPTGAPGGGGGGGGGAGPGGGGGRGGGGGPRRGGGAPPFGRRRDPEAEEGARRRPYRIAVELQTARVARAVWSERQLQEVMVDFWFNHF